MLNNLSSLRVINFKIKKRKMKFTFTIISVALILYSCQKETKLEPKDPKLAEKISIDRFSANHGTLMLRTEENNLPEANEPINFDEIPFITQSLGPDGQIVKYYNFDLQLRTPAPIYVLFRNDSSTPVENQLNIIDVIPGELSYSDFWQVYRVSVPDNYVANTVTSYQEILDEGFSISRTSTIVNCPVVPYGSTANTSLDDRSSILHQGWYKGKGVFYFSFEEKNLIINELNLVKTSPIYVAFNINPDENNPDSGPASGFVTEPGSVQTHNVIATIPSDDDYSPLWSVFVYNNTDFELVKDLNSVEASDILMENVMYVNCPVVYIEN